MCKTMEQRAGVEKGGAKEGEEKGRTADSGTTLRGA